MPTAKRRKTSSFVAASCRHAAEEEDRGRAQHAAMRFLPFGNASAGLVPGR